MLRSSSWPKNQQKLAISMAAQGALAHEIAFAIGRTKNAVVGWFWRNNISFRHQHHQVGRRKPQNEIKCDVVIKLPQKPKAIVEPRNERVEHCQWLHDDPRYRNFCKSPAVSGYSYCQEHRLICFQLTSHRKII